MALDGVGNFGKVEVSTGYDASATSIVLATDEGAKLPDPSGDNYNVTWYNWTDYKDPADDPNVEIVRVTAKSTDTLTVSRNQESSGASTKNTADKTYKMVLGVTAKMITDIETQLNAKLETVAVSDLDNGTDGELITWDASGVADTVAVGTADQVLTSNGAGAAPTFQDAGGGGGNKVIWLDANQGGLSGTGVTQHAVLGFFASGAVMSDGNDNQRCAINWATPSDFTSITSVEAYWLTAATSGSAYLTFKSLAMGEGEVYSSVTQDSIALAQYATDTTQFGLNVTDVTAMINGLTLSAGDVIGMNFQRNGADALDTLTNSVRFLGFRVVYE